MNTYKKLLFLVLLFFPVQGFILIRNVNAEEICNIVRSVHCSKDTGVYSKNPHSRCSSCASSTSLSVGLWSTGDDYYWQEAYIFFDLSDEIKLNPSKFELKISVTTAGANLNCKVYQVGNWDPDTITWDSRPAKIQEIGVFRVKYKDSSPFILDKYTIDITNFAQDKTSFSICLSTDQSTYMRISSYESGYGPKVLVSYKGPCSDIDEKQDNSVPYDNNDSEADGGEEEEEGNEKKEENNDLNSFPFLAAISIIAVVLISIAIIIKNDRTFTIKNNIRNLKPSYILAFELKGKDVPLGMLNFIKNSHKSEGIISKNNLTNDFLNKGIDFCKFRVVNGNIIIRGFRKE